MIESTGPPAIRAGDSPTCNPLISPSRMRRCWEDKCHLRHADIDWLRTIGANLRQYQPQDRAVVPETLVGHTRHTKTRAELVG
jgi:hypothetical protein